MTLNGDAVASGAELRLVGAQGSLAGSAFFSTPVRLERDTSVVATFGFRIGGGDGLSGGDGVAFLIQAAPQGARALGGPGSGGGYRDIAPSVAVAFDTVAVSPPLDSDRVRLVQDGQQVDAGLAEAALPPLNDGVARRAWIAYDAGRSRLSVYLSEQQQPRGAPQLVYDGLPIEGQLGTQVYVGFAAATGVRINQHDLLGEAWIVTGPEAPCP